MTQPTKKIFPVIIFLLISFTGISQDFHLSQYDAHPLYLNPALTGLRMNEEWDYRANANYRSQWSQFPGRPYATAAAGVDLPISKKFSIGEFIINNESAGGYINTFNLMSSLAYNLTHKNSGGDEQYLSVGLQIGLLQKALNPANLVFDSQYSASSPDAFDKQLPSGETFTQVSVFKFDANMGVFYMYSGLSGRFTPFLGFSIYHLARPDESFTGVNSRTPIRFTLHGGSRYKIGEQLSLLPHWLYMSQAKATELNLGILAFYKIRDTDWEPLTGFALRNEDAMIIHLGIKHKIGVFRISYDINTSNLRPYSKGMGGPELSLIYTGKRKGKSTPKTPPPAEGKKANL